MALLGRFHGYFPGYSRALAEQLNYLSWTIVKAHTNNRAGEVTLRSADPRWLRDSEVHRNAQNDSGDNAGDLDASVSGNALEISFNVKYLIDLLSVAGSAQVLLETNSASQPGLIRPIGNDNFLHVIMPMHIGGR